VLILNGGLEGGADFGGLRKPVLTARLYHSNAILNLDGRVLITGSTPQENSNVDNSLVLYPTERRAEAYSPPYLSIPRPAPTILSASGSIGYNERMTIRATIPSGNTSTVSVSLINPGVVTHQNHMGNTHLVLLIDAIVPSGTPGEYTITAWTPTDAILAPPQYYMLWVVDGGKPCSSARWIKVGSSTIAWPTF
jgi:hypothetical protein